MIPFPFPPGDDPLGMSGDPSRQLMSFAGLPSAALSSSLGLLQLQHQMAQQQQQAQPGMMPRGGLPVPYSSPSQFQRPMFPSNSSVPSLSASPSSWSPYFLFARGPQPFMSLADAAHATTNGLPIMSRAMMGGMNTSGAYGAPKDNILNNSIENLRIRARQHSASLGYYE